MDQDPEPWTVLLGEADDGGLVLLDGEVSGLVPQADGGEALPLLTLDEEIRVEGIGPGEFTVPS